MTVQVLLPRLLSDCTGGRTSMTVDLPASGTVCALLDVLAADHPVFDRRVRDETGALRRHVNVYVDRERAGLETALRPDSRVDVISAISGG